MSPPRYIAAEPTAVQKAIVRHAESSRRRARFTTARVGAALSLADTLCDMLAGAKDPDDFPSSRCPLCGEVGGEHDTDWGDGAGGCPVLVYLRAREASKGGP